MVPSSPAGRSRTNQEKEQLKFLFPRIARFWVVKSVSRLSLPFLFHLVDVGIFRGGEECKPTIGFQRYF